MIEDTKTFLLLIGVAISSAYIRYRGFLTAISDAFLSFWLGFGLYHALAYFAISPEVRSGITCIMGLFARPIYDWGNNFISKNLSKLLERKIGGGNND